jgi:enoyl-CoA hydratase/carnithine racemase
MASIDVQVSRDGIATILLNRLQTRNALDWDAMYAFSEVVDRVHAGVTPSALILTGAGGTFCSGGDLVDLHESISHADGVRLSTVMGQALERLASLACPTIAAIEGYAIGGGAEIALACDLRVMGREAQIGLTHVRLAICPAWGGGQRLLGLVGYSQALEWLIGGEMLSAEAALSGGLATHLVEAGEALAGAHELVHRFSGYDPQSVRSIKRLLRAGLERDRDSALAIEREIFADLWAAPAHLQASDAFIARKNHRVRR